MVLDKKDGELNKNTIDRNTHDIKNQLMIIMSMVNNINNMSENNDINKYAYFIKEAVCSCRYMLSNIDKDIHEMPYENNQLMNTHYVIASLLESFYAEKTIKFINKMNADNPRIYANKVLITNAIYNIIINAAEEIAYAGTIKIKTYNKNKNPISRYECSQWLYIEIEDSGNGINIKNKDQVFEECFTTKKDKRGLGLYSAKNAIQRHNGTIHIKSSKAKGSTFIICLPCHVE